MHKSSFSNTDLMKILGRPSRFLIDWTERGLIDDDIIPATGPGSRRRYSYQATLRAALGLHLKERYGMSRSIIKNILDQLSDIITDWGMDFIGDQKKFNEKMALLIKNQPDNPEAQALLSKYQNEPEPLLNHGCLSIFFHDDGSFTFYADPHPLKQVTPLIGGRIKKEEEAGNPVTDMLFVDLASIKNKIDQRIKALA